VDELVPGLWTWTARHPEWRTPEDGWGPVVRSYALASDGVLVLVDPLAPPADIERLAAGRDVAVLLTGLDHERSTADCVTRFRASVHAPAEAAAHLATPASGYAVGDALPGGVVAQTGFWSNEATLWAAAYGALFTGDVLLNEHGLSISPDDWFADAATPEQVRAGLRPLLELPVELVLPTHGEPVVEEARTRLAAALRAR
jgi:hypothetical protein